MAPSIVAAKAVVSIPLYACDFDPLEPSRLVVAGGGGASKTGVGNKIIIFEASRAKQLVVAVESELSKNEDNPTSLAVGQDRLIYAGLNSSPKDIAEGKNLHFRIFEIENACKKEKDIGIDTESSGLKIVQKSKCSLFSGQEKDIYQRVTRLVRPYPGHKLQLGAVTTGLAQKHEIVLFETVGPYPPNIREILQIEKEAVDVDICHIDGGESILAYCDESSIYTKKIAPETDDVKLQCKYTIQPSRNNQKTKSSLKSIRWLMKDHIVALTNLHGNNGVTLSIIAFSFKGKFQYQVIQSIRLSRRVTKATGLCLANLTPIEIPMKDQSCTQFVIAVAGHDSSLLVFTVDVKLNQAGNSEVSRVIPFHTMNKVHPLQITCLAFSSLHPTNSPKKSNDLGLLPLRLASVGISNTVVVHTLPLFPILSSTLHGQMKYYRYVVAVPSRKNTKGLLLGICTTVVLLLAILIKEFFK